MSKTTLFASVVSVLLGSGFLFTSQAMAAGSSGGQTTELNAADPNVPGATGTTIVRGNNSTIAGDAKATREQQTGAYSGG